MCISSFSVYPFWLAMDHRERLLLCSHNGVVNSVIIFKCDIVFHEMTSEKIPKKVSQRTDFLIHPIPLKRPHAVTTTHRPVSNPITPSGE